jgi:hypothetical protein
MMTVLLTAPLVAVAAPPALTVFQPNTVIKSADVNANFADLQTRIAALETAAASHRGTTITQVLDNVPGPLPLGGGDSGANSGSFMSNGGQLVVVASGSAWTNKAGGDHLSLIVELDGVKLGALEVYTNESVSHKAMPTRAYVGTALPAGSHTISLVPDTTTTSILSDSNDLFSVSVIELGN